MQSDINSFTFFAPYPLKGHHRKLSISSAVAHFPHFPPFRSFLFMADSYWVALSVIRKIGKKKGRRFLEINMRTDGWHAMDIIGANTSACSSLLMPMHCLAARWGKIPCKCHRLVPHPLITGPTSTWLIAPPHKPRWYISKSLSWWKCNLAVFHNYLPWLVFINRWEGVSIIVAIKRGTDSDWQLSGKFISRLMGSGHGRAAAKVYIK